MSCLVWPQQGGEGFVMGADAREVGLLVVRQAKPGFLTMPFLGGLCGSGGPAARSMVSAAG